MLKDVLIEDQKQDSLLFVHELEASIDSVSFKKTYIGIGQLKLNKTYLNIYSDSLGVPNYQFLLGQIQSKDTMKTDSLKIDFRMKQFDFNDARLKLAYRDSSGNHLVFLNDIFLGVSDLVVNDEIVAMNLTKFQMNNEKGLELADFSAQLVATSDSVKVLKLRAKTANSEITEANIRIDKSKVGTDLDIKKLKVNLDIKKSRISMKDIGQLVPILRGMDEDIEVSGQISGRVADLKGKNIELSLGRNTRLAFDFYLNGLPDISKTYMQFDLKQSFADFRDLSNIKLPDHFPLEQIKVPLPLLQAGIIEYKGNFTGFLSDFVAYGTFSSKWGVLNTDLSFVPLPGKKLQFNGRIKTVDFQLKELAQTEILDRITFNGDIQGILNPNTHNFMAKVSGKIDSMAVNDYQYKNFQLNGDILNRKFEGSLIADDPNLKFHFGGKFDLNLPVPVFNFDILVEKADLKALKLVDKYKESKISFALNANFTGNNIDNLAGLIHFRNGTYQNENGILPFDNIDLTTFNENEPVLQLRSDFLDADIRGEYALHKLAYSVKKIITNYLPSAGIKIPDQEARNNFDFRLELKDINRYTQVLLPSLKVDPTIITGNINSDKNTIMLNANFPKIQFQNVVLKKLALNLNGGSKLTLRNKVDEIELNGDTKVFNLSMISEASGDVLDSKLAWNNFGELTYSGSILTSTKFVAQKNYPHVEISIHPSRVYLADIPWQINPAIITVDSTLIRVNKLKFSNNAQSITADGSIDKSQENKLNILFDQIDLSTLNTFLAGDIDLKGSLNGSLTLFDIYQRVLFLADLKIEGLGLLGQPMGNAGVQSRWDPAEEDIVAELVVETEKKNSLLAFGTYNPSRDSLSIDTNFDHFSLLILQPLLGSAFADVHGNASGKVRITGPLNHIQHNGALLAENAGLKLSDLQVNYRLSDSVKFIADKIVFPDIRIQDDFGNSGIFSGSIQHHSFSKMQYDLSVKSGKIMAFNTTPEINEQFYGKMFVSGDFLIKGTDDNLLLDGVARTEKGTEMNISLTYEGDTQQYDFISFLSHGYQPRITIPKNYVSQSGGLQMKFNVEVTPEAKEQLIYNSKIGDVIKAQGSGSMQIAVDNNYNVSLFGEYTFEQGDYLFTLQNVINKKFEIQRGGTIQWNGDPVDAIINLNALYRLKTSLSELFAADPTKSYNQRIPVICKINLSKSLNNPDIKFDIELPTAEERIKDEVKQFINSEEDMNKQILSLLVLSKFYTPEYLRGTTSFAGTNTSLAGSTATTASELVSNQLSNWLSQISHNVNVGVNYRPGNQITPDEMELALSTLMFNNRVSINGNIGNNMSQKTNTNNNEIVGEADINVKLTDNGKLQLKAYNHSNNNLIYETSPYTQGVGIAYREDFNNIHELWQKVKSIFKRKTK